MDRRTRLEKLRAMALDESSPHEAMIARDIIARLPPAPGVVVTPSRRPVRVERREAPSPFVDD